MAFWCKDAHTKKWALSAFLFFISVSTKALLLHIINILQYKLYCNCLHSKRMFFFTNYRCTHVLRILCKLLMLQSDETANVFVEIVFLKTVVINYHQLTVDSINSSSKKIARASFLLLNGHKTFVGDKLSIFVFRYINSHLVTNFYCFGYNVVAENETRSSIFIFKRQNDLTPCKRVSCVSYMHKLSGTKHVLIKVALQSLTIGSKCGYWVLTYS